MPARPSACLWGGLCVYSYQFVDGVVLNLLYLFDIAMLKSLPFLGMLLCIVDDQGLSCGFSGYSSLPG